MSIIQELGNLALAVMQAGAYIFQSECGLNRYLEMYLEHRGALLEEYGDNVQRVDDYRRTVHTTWGISFKRLSEQSATFLQLCTFLHHDGISEQIFQDAASNIATYEPMFPATEQESDAMNKAKDFLGMFRTGDFPWHSQKFLKMIREIRSYSLLDFDSANKTYSIHPLVHAWTRTTISNDKAIRTTVAWILGLPVAWEFNSDDYTFRRSLQSHIDTLLKRGKIAALEFFSEFGLIYSEAGRWRDAEELEVQVMQACLRLFGPEHPDTLVSIGNLASTYSDQGRWKEAEELQVQVKEVCLRMLGAEHPDTLISMGNLALTYWNQGRWKGAEELQVQVKETRLRLFGAEHPDTLSSMGNLASTYADQGLWKEAEELQVHVKEVCLRLLGAEHPDTLLSMGNLAWTYWDQGRWKEAKELRVQVKEARPRLLVKVH